MTYDFTKEEQAALKAAWATDHGRAALTVVMERLGLLGKVPFNPDPHVNAFNMGRLFVAQALREGITSPLKEEDHGTGINSKHAVATATERAAADAIQRATGRTKRARAGTGTRAR